MRISKEFALFYGILLGDGCLSYIKPKHYSVSITGHKQDDLNFMNNVVGTIIKKISKKERQLKYRKNQNTIEYNFCCKELFIKLNKIGFPIGKKGPNLKISENILEKYHKEILQGYFATDGSFFITNNNGTIYPRIEAVSISYALLKQIKEILAKKNIQSTIYNKIQTKENALKAYRLQINGKNNLKKFVKEIGFINHKQRSKLQAYEKSVGGGI